MSNEGKEVYPIMPIKGWWELRKRFTQSMPTSKITDTYLSSVLSIGIPAARNLLSPLKRIGILEQDGIPRDRAKTWRDDEQYPQVCEAIRREIYPSELLDAFPSPSESDRDAIERWFSNKTGAGSAAVRKMSAFYLMLSEADPKKMTEPAKLKVEKPKATPMREPKGKIKEKPETMDTEGELGIPSVNINIQVHISSDASSTQIDHIFESMAKHLNISRKTANE